MAKKAKRRGRPPGSKNKKSIGKSVAAMEIGQLCAHIEGLQGVLTKKVNEQRAFLEHQLSSLGGYVSRKTSSAVNAVGLEKADRRAKPKAKYQSKKNRSLKWTGRGLTPRWMREE